MQNRTVTPSPAYLPEDWLARTVLVIVFLVTGNELLARQPTLGPPELGKVTVHSLHYFTVRDYTPPVPVLSTVGAERSPLDTPEDAALAHFGSILEGNYEHWLALWDETSREGMIKRNTENGRDATFWKKRWRKSFGPFSTFELTRRVDTDAFVIIVLRASGADDERDDRFLDTILKRDPQGKWRPTNSFGRDPIPANWRFPETPIKIIGREPPKL